MKRAIGYRRVSTTEQGDSGAGLEAQQASIVREVEHKQFDLLEVATDIGSGKNMTARPELRRENARLSVERDRLAAALAAAQEREADAWDACYEAWVKTVGGDFHPNLLNPYRAALAGEGAADQPHEENR